MGSLPRPTGKEMLRFLDRQGYQLLRIRGSHHFLEGRGGRTALPIHDNEVLKIGTLRSILRDIHMTPADFAQAWNA